MAAPWSDPHCLLCESYADGLACGVCTERYTGRRDASAKRASTTKKRERTAASALNAFRRRRSAARGPRGQGDVPRVAWLQCANKHAWQSEATPGKDEPVLDPRCPDCDEFFNRMHYRSAVYNPDIPCTAKCQNAQPWTDCECSCGGANHGAGPPDAGVDDPAA